MSIQTFSKSFLFSNNKEKLKIKHPIATGPARGNQLAHDHTRPARPERRERAAAWQGLRPMASWPSLAEAKVMPAPRRRGGVARPTGPAAITGRARANERAHAVHEELANAGR